MSSTTSLNPCVVCEDGIHPTKTIKAACGHHYCHVCILELFHLSVKDSSLFPPQCCGTTIPVSTFRDLLTPEQIAKYELKNEELGSPRPTYCSSGKCNIFIKPANIVAEKATCTTCGEETCTICKLPSHAGSCTKDEDMENTEEVARREGWQRCPRCNRMVSIIRGCNHIVQV